MNKMFGNFLCLLLTSSLMPYAFAAPDSPVTAKVMALKDYESAKVKIQADNQAAMAECAKLTGPTAAACKIQAHAKHDAADNDAKIILDRASETPALSDKERKKASDDARARAKADYDIAKARITSAHRAANTECSMLRGDAREACRAEVSARTADAEAQAKYLYTRDIVRAKSIAPP
ncbi:MAG: hypothetical protein ABWY05_07780 [Noviherbaspirillum sp.]